MLIKRLDDTVFTKFLHKSYLFDTEVVMNGDN